MARSTVKMSMNPVSPWTDEFGAGGSSDLVTIVDRTSDMELTLTNDADLQPAVAAEFVALADLLGSASDAQWDLPSLCEGWRVREVIAHLTMAARYSEEEFMAELRHCGFDFSRLSNQIMRPGRRTADRRTRCQPARRRDAPLDATGRWLPRRAQSCGGPWP